MPSNVLRKNLKALWREGNEGFIEGRKQTNNQSEVKTMYEDKTLVCKDCGKEFTFSAGEQEFYAEKGF